ncbi:MAG: BON domain-containing protein [Candidatus Protistobacter heckmanni]|nr:BON domain-containing protein [Candidatus Protistobacter heckmanni]
MNTTMQTRMPARTFHARSGVLALCAALALPVLLAGCAPMLIGAAAGGTASVAADRRTVSQQAIDRGLQLEADSMLDLKIGQRGNVGASVFNGRILLSGEVRNEQDKALAETTAKALKNAREVINEIVVGPLSSVRGRVQDTYLTSRVKAAMIVTSGVPSNSMRIVTANGVVFLMGLATENEGRVAADVASGIGGVRRVVKFFETLSPEELKAIEKRQSDEGKRPAPNQAPAK